MRRASCLLAAAVLVAGGAGCSPPPLDLTKALTLDEVTTGWFDAGIQDRKNKLVPSISFKIRNASDAQVRSVFLTAVFRRVNEEENWGDAYVRGVDPDGLQPGGVTAPIVMRCSLGYTGEQPRREMLQHKDFRDVQVFLFAKHGPEPPVKIGEFLIERQLLTQ
jgi:hypothetical protein